MAGSVEPRKYRTGEHKGEQRKDKAGKLVWRLVVYAGTCNGKRARIKREFHGSPRAADRELARLVTEVDNGTVAAASSQMLLSTWAEVWLKDHAEKHLTARTVASYRLIIQKRIIPALGHFSLDKLTSRHISTFYANLEEEGIRHDGRGETLSGSTRLKYHRVLSSLLQEAVYRHLLPANPAHAVRPPRSKRHEAHFYDEDDARRLIKALDQESLRFRTFILLAITLGLRRGEIIGLEWSHIDFTYKTLTVVQAAQLISGKGQSLKAPKTATSNRIVSLSEFVVASLEEWQKEQQRQRDIASESWKPSPHGDFIFTDPDGSWYLADQASKDFRHFADANNLQTVPLRRLTVALESEADRLRAFAILAFSTAIRRETIIKLMWEQVDFERGIITIFPPSTNTQQNDDHLLPSQEVAIPDYAVEILLKWQQQQNIEKHTAGDKWQGKRYNFIFTNSNGTRYRTRQAVNDLRKFMVKNELQTISLHGLRHTAASILLGKGLPIRTISGILGHAQASTTLNIYSHVMQATVHQAADIMDAMKTDTPPILPPI